MIDNRVLGLNKKKYNKLPDCLNNMLDVSEIKINYNVNLNVIKNINNKDIDNSKVIDAKTLCSFWFKQTVTRSEACSVLESSNPGSFLVRRSNSLNSWVLSMAGMKESDVLHLLIHTNKRGVRFQGSQKIFPNIYSLILHLSIMQESLPCTLNLHTSASGTENDTFHEDDLVDIEKEPQLEIIISKMKKKMVWG